MADLDEKPQIQASNRQADRRSANRDSVPRPPLVSARSHAHPELLPSPAVLVLLVSHARSLLPYLSKHKAGQGRAGQGKARHGTARYGGEDKRHVRRPRGGDGRQRNRRKGGREEGREGAITGRGFNGVRGRPQQHRQPTPWSAHGPRPNGQALACFCESRGQPHGVTFPGSTMSTTVAGCV